MNDLEKTRLIPFEYNRNLSYLITLAPQGEYFYVRILDINGSFIYEGLSPISVDNYNFQYRQVEGWVYFAHANFKPLKLAYDGENWEWSEAIELYPSLDTYEDTVLSFNLGGDGVVYSGTTANITSTSSFFTDDMVGSQLMIEYSETVSQSYVWNYSAGVTSYVSDIFPAGGSVTVAPKGGVWDGTLILESSTDNGATWEELGRTTSVQGSDNESFSRDVYDPQAVVRVRLTDQNEVVETDSVTVEESTEGCRFSVYSDGDATFWCKITSVSTEYIASIELLTPCRASITSSRVYKSSWSSTYGYPRAIELHEERLALAGTSKQNSTVWLSQTNNWGNFRSASDLDTDPLAFTLAADNGDPISWLVSKEDLMIGLGNSEWSLGSRDSSSALTSSVVKASLQSRGGVEYIMPTMANGMVIYVKRGTIHLSSILYDFASDAYNSTDLTTMCPSILGASGAKEIFNQLSPENRIWVVRNDGGVSVFTFNKENNVSAWAEMSFGDGVVSACALSTGLFYSVFLLVIRNGYLILERLDPNENGTNNWLDCVPMTNSLSLPDEVETNVQYTSKLKTFPLVVDGNTKVWNLQFFMLSSMGGKYRTVGFNSDGEEKKDKWQKFNFKENEIFKSNIEVRDFRYRGAVDIGYLEEMAIEIKSDYEAPLQLCAIGIKAKQG